MASFTFNSEAYYEYLRNNEGFEPKVYKDTEGIDSIGYGLNLEIEDNRRLLEEDGYDVDAILSGKQEITPEDAEKYMRSAGETAIQAAFNFVSDFSSLSQDRQTILADMAYNLGEEGLNDFVNLREAIDAEDWEGAAQEIENSKYFGQVKTRGVRNRDGMRTGELQDPEARALVQLNDVSDIPLKNTVQESALSIPPATPQSTGFTIKEPEPVVQLPSNARNNLIDQAVKAAMTYSEGDNSIEVTRKAITEVDSGNQENLRMSIAELERSSRQKQILAGIQAGTRDPTKQAEDLIDQMMDYQEVKLDRAALEKQASKAALAASNGSPDWSSLNSVRNDRCCSSVSVPKSKVCWDPFSSPSIRPSLSAISRR